MPPGFSSGLSMIRKAVSEISNTRAAMVPSTSRAPPAASCCATCARMAQSRPAPASPVKTRKRMLRARSVRKSGPNPALESASSSAVSVTMSSTTSTARGLQKSGSSNRVGWDTAAPVLAGRRPWFSGRSGRAGEVAGAAGLQAGGVELRLVQEDAIALVVGLVHAARLHRLLVTGFCLLALFSLGGGCFLADL